MRLARSVVFGGVLLSAVACRDRKIKVDRAPSPVERPSIDAVGPSGLFLSPDRTTVRDANQGVTWLADANLAGDAAVRAAMGVEGIRPNGTMTYDTALRWVEALNKARYLGHDDWQLPTTPLQDDTCAVAAGPDGNSFGPGCKGSAMGRLYSAGFLAGYPTAIARATNHLVSPFHHVQQGMYWTSGMTRDESPRGAESAYTYNFTNHERGRKTTKGNYFHVLPMVVGSIGPKPEGSGLVPYTTGDAAGLAVYDSVYHVTWPLDGALATSKNYLISGTVEVTFPRATFTPPRIDADGKMMFATAHAWIEAMNRFGYAGSSRWALPSSKDLAYLDEHLDRNATDRGLVEDGGRALPFRNLQLFFYWSCPGANGEKRASCRTAAVGDGPNEGGGGAAMQFAYNFGSGFQGTDKASKEYFVLVYYPHP
jgi:hypothetical protein